MRGGGPGEDLSLQWGVGLGVGERMREALYMCKSGGVGAVREGSQMMGGGVDPARVYLGVNCRELGAVSAELNWRPTHFSRV